MRLILIRARPVDRAGDTATIEASEMYASMATRRKEIRSVMANAPSAGVEEVGG